MRREPTPAEARLWRSLRSKQLGGLHFRRQAPIGSFIADFFCPALRLIIEVDGDSHAESGADETRDAWLRAEGYEIVRFWNNEVIKNLDGVLMRIGEICAALPPPGPLPEREGE